MAKETLSFPTGFKKNEIDKSDYTKSIERKTWDLSLLFLEGRQWMTWDNTARNMAGYPEVQGDYRITVNLLLNIYRNLLSKLATTYPGVVVSPASPSTEDILKAQSSEMALKYYWKETDMKDKLGRSFEWLLSCGTVGYHNYYDPEAKQVVTEIVSPFDLVFEPYVDDPKESLYIGIRRHIAKEELQRTNRPGSASLQNVPKNRVEIFEVYWKDGRHAILMGDNYLYAGKNDLGYIPIEVLRYTQVPGKLWGIGLIAPLIDMQWLYNKSRSQVIKNIELMSNPKWLIPKSSGINPNAITNRPGEKVYYNAAGGVPQQIGAAPLPAHVFDNITKLQGEMMDVSGIHSTSLGKRAVGITSGKAMQTLAAQDMSQLQQTQLRIEESCRRISETVLSLMKMYYQESRMVRMFDDAGKIVFRELRSTDIVDVPDVFIEAGSLFRSETQDRDRKIYDMLEMGLIQPETALKELSFKTGNKYVIDKMESMAHAKELLDAAIVGYDIEIFKTDDLESFKTVFGDFIKSPEYYSIAEERQEYLRDVFIAIENAGMNPQQLGQENIQEKVFPRQPAPTAEDTEMLAGVMGQGSGAAQAQQLEEALGAKAIESGFGRAEQALAGRQDALVQNISPGGVG
jgi:hypothetical protein